MKREQVRALRDKLAEHLKKLDTPTLKFKVGNIQYADTTIDFKVECTVADQSGQLVTKEEADFKAHAHLMGLKPEHLGKTFTFRGKQYKITGMNRKATANPVITICNGKCFVFPAQTVRSCMNKGSGRTEADILRDILDIEAALSPENLSHDGELDPTEAAKHAVTLTLRKEQLIKELGRQPTKEELRDSPQ